MTEAKFATELGVSARTANAAVKARFGEFTAGQPAGLPGSAQALRVAIAVVLRDEQVLLVRRRDKGDDGIAWQFRCLLVSRRVSARSSGSLALRWGGPRLARRLSARG